MRNILKPRSASTKITVMGTAAILMIGFFPGSANATETPLSLGSASTYAVLANAAITSATSSGVTGTAGADVGVGGATAPSGPLVLAGTTFLGGPSLTALIAASGALADNRGGVTTGVELGSTTKLPGAYNNSSLAINGTLTLDALGDPAAVFIFRSTSTLITGASSTVLLTNGAQACNVFWQVGSSATLGTSSTIVGHVIAYASITTGTSSFVDGQLVATTAAVTLGGTTIVNNACVAPVVTPAVTATPAVTSTPGVGPGVGPILTPTPTVVPTTPVVTPTVTPTDVPTPVVTPTVTPTVVPTVTPTVVPTVVPTDVPTPVVTPTDVPTPVVTPTVEETKAPVVVTEDGGALPNTSTPWGNLILCGGGLIALGGLGFASRKSLGK